MAVITLSREMGSLGDDIARAVAARLGLRLVGRELINRAAKEAGAPEVALAEIDPGADLIQTERGVGYRLVE